MSVLVLTPEILIGVGAWQIAVHRWAVGVPLLAVGLLGGTLLSFLGRRILRGLDR